MARESFKATPGDRVKLQVIETDDRPMTVDLDGKLDPVMLPADDGSNDNDTNTDGTTRDPAEWGSKNATDPRGVTPRVQKRFDRLKAETETERRIRIQTEQERDEARRVAAAATAEVNDLRQRLATNTTSLATSMTEERKVRIADAERRLSQAHAEGNSEAIAAATRDMTTAAAELTAIAANTPRPRAEAEQPRQQEPPRQQQQQAPQLSPDVVAWVSATPRFNRDVEFTRTAVSIHNLLEAKGIKPGSPNYITELDKRMKAEYPDHQPYSGSHQDDGDDEDRSSTPRRTNAVAPGSRETRQPSNPRTMELSPRQVAIAKGLGLTTKEQLARYAAEIQKREPNGSSA